jgi:hypothetical protein
MQLMQAQQFDWACLKMKAIRRSEVPTYLHTSDFYLSLDEEDDEILQIPEINFKETKTVAD